MPTPARLRVLCFAESVTLAHLARVIALARRLDPSRYEVVVACDQRDAGFLQGEPARHAAITSLSRADFARALARGDPVYDAACLRRYVEEDLAQILAVRPDLIVSDFRLSLSVSARIARVGGRTGVPLVAIANAYWCPGWQGGNRLPVLPITRWLPLGLVRPIFNFLAPHAFAQHCKPLNQVRAEHGLASLGTDLRRVYTDADAVLVADDASLYPLGPASGRYYRIEPLLWSPRIDASATWAAVDGDRPCVYVSLGSSGRHDLLPRVLHTLAELPVTLVCSTAGHALPPGLPHNVIGSAFLPGDEATARSRLVVCNGGSLTTQQALVCGVPVLGIASNMDQFLNMDPLVAGGVARLLRSDRLDDTLLRRAAQSLLDGPSAKRAAEAAAHLGRQLKSAPAAGPVFDAVAETLLRT